MATNNIHIRDAGDDFDAVERSRKWYYKKMQCMCTHVREDGFLPLFKVKRKSKYTGNPLFICNICMKPIDIAPISEEELNRAIDTLSRQIDIIKIRTAVSTGGAKEEDEKLYLEMYRVQKFLIAKLPDMAAAARKKANTLDESKQPKSRWCLILEAIRSHKPKTIGDWINLFAAVIFVIAIIWLAASVFQVSAYADPWNANHGQPYSFWNFFGW